MHARSRLCCWTLLLASVALLAAGCSKKEFPAELEAYRTAVEASKLEYVRIRADSERGTAPWASKFRGTPYRPKGMAYPLGRDGQPLSLLAQINFADMPPLTDYPRAGILQFFIGGEGKGHIWGMALDDEQPYDENRHFQKLQDQAYFRVVYHPVVTTDLEELDTDSPPIPDWVLPVMTEAALTFETDAEYVQVYDYRFEKVFGKDPSSVFDGDDGYDLANRYAEFSYRPGLAKVGGYASFVQEDPRRIRPAEDWLVLLEIRSGFEGDVEAMWGDAGVGVFMIRRADLKKLDFSHVAYNWDNH